MLLMVVMIVAAATGLKDAPDPHHTAARLLPKQGTIIATAEGLW